MSQKGGNGGYRDVVHEIHSRYRLVDPRSDSAETKYPIAAQTQPITVINNRHSITHDNRPRTLNNDRSGSKCAGSETTHGLNALQLLHIRLNHASKQVLLRMLMTNSATGLGTTYKACKDLTIGPCDACLKSKLTVEQISPRQNPRSLLPNQRDVYMDTMTMDTPSLQGNKYITFIFHEPTDRIFAYFSPTKEDQHVVLRKHYEEMLRPRGLQIRHVYSDCEGVYLNRKFQAEFASSPPYADKKNAKVQRAIQAIMDITSVSLRRHHSPKDLWQLAMGAAIYIRNRMPFCREKEGISPHEKCTGEKPDLSLAHPFDCPAWWYVDNNNDPSRQGCVTTAFKCQMVGYSNTCPGAYFVMEADRVVKVRNQVLCEEYAGMRSLENPPQAADLVQVLCPRMIALDKAVCPVQNQEGAMVIADRQNAHIKARWQACTRDSDGIEDITEKLFGVQPVRLRARSAPLLGFSSGAQRDGTGSSTEYYQDEVPVWP